MGSLRMYWHESLRRVFDSSAVCDEPEGVGVRTKNILKNRDGFRSKYDLLENGVDDCLTAHAECAFRQLMRLIGHHLFVTRAGLQTHSTDSAAFETAWQGDELVRTHILSGKCAE